MRHKSFRVLVCAVEDRFLAPMVADLKRDFDVQSAPNETIAQFLMKEWDPHVCLMDSQATITRSLRGLRVTFPKTGFLTLLRDSDVRQEVRCFEMGADQIWVLASSVEGLRARITALIRRLRPEGMPTGHTEAILESAPERIDFKEVSLFPREHIAKRSDVPLLLSPIQFRLLFVFLQNPEKLLSRERLREVVWDNAAISPRSIDAQISKLKKLVPELDSAIVNIYGRGYVLMTHSAGGGGRSAA